MKTNKKKEENKQMLYLKALEHNLENRTVSKKLFDLIFPVDAIDFQLIKML